MIKSTIDIVLLQEKSLQSMSCLCKVKNERAEAHPAIAITILSDIGVL